MLMIQFTLLQNNTKKMHLGNIPEYIQNTK